MSTCGTCGQENPEGFRFCGNCGALLAAEAPPEREERKVVTVLFADLVGFTSEAERLDPEDVRGILAGYHAMLRGELERHGGTVEKFIGDAVMALFGAPVTHEDDPERAVRAALAIRDALAERRSEGGRELHVRIGITTGEALIRLGARPAAGEGMAAGDVVNTAARLQSAAPVDGIVVDDATFRATERAIAYRVAEPVHAKGKAEPVPVWEALSAVASLGVDVARSARTPLVGRDRELAVLREALARVRRDREPQLVTLVGVPGIGKSRLVYELLQVVEADPELIVWRQGRCLPYGEGGSFRALADVVKAQAGILETDHDAEALAKLRRAVEALLPDAGEAGWVERQLRPLAGLGDDARTPGEGEAFAAWRRFVESLAEDRPAVVILEDVQWADDALLDFVEHLTDWATGVPLLVVCVARPELLSRRPAWGGGKPNAATLSLAPLADDEIARLLAALLDRALMPADVQAALLARAGGNPLFAEEFARLAQESGVGDVISVPQSVQATIAARLDVLDPVDKALLQDAAVIGKVFWLGAAAALAELEREEAERRLHELARRQMVRRERRSAVAGESEYSFWHVLVREVAYGQIPRAERARRHRLAAEWIATLSPERLADRSDLVAHHYLAALEFARASGQDTSALVDPARRAARAAGDRALALSAFAAAERAFRTALELWPADDPERPRVLFGLARAIFGGQDRGEEELAEARDALLAAGDVEGAAEAETILGEIAWSRGRTKETLERLERAATLVAGVPVSPAKAYVVANLSRFLMLAGRSAEAIARGREALAMAEQLGLDELRAHALDNIGGARGTAGELEEGLADIAESIAIAERIGSTEAIRGYINLASGVGLRGDLRRCKELHLRAHELAERFGQRRGLTFLAAELSTDAFALGDWDEASSRAVAFLREVEASGEPHYMEGPVRMTLAAIAAGRGRAGEARAGAARSVALGRDAADPQALLPALAAQAVLAADLSDRELAAASLDELWSTVVSLEGLLTGLWLYPSIHALDDLGRLAELDAVVRELGATRWAQAAQLHLGGDLPAAADVLAEIGSRTDEARTRLRAAELLTAEGRSAEAHAQLERAFAFYREVGAQLYLRRGERLLPASA